MKHLMRGVSLGLFDAKAAEEKFEKWNASHEQLVAQREETHRKHKSEKRHKVAQESIRLVEEKNAVKAAAVQTTAAETATEEPTANDEAPAAE